MNTVLGHKHYHTTNSMKLNAYTNRLEEYA